MLKFDWLTSRKILLLKQCWNLTGWRAEKYFYWNNVEIWLADGQKILLVHIFETTLKFDWLTSRKILLLKQCWNLTGWRAEKYFYWNNVEIWLADGQKILLVHIFETTLKFDWLTSRKILLLKQCWNLTGWRAEKYIYCIPLYATPFRYHEVRNFINNTTCSIAQPQLQCHYLTLLFECLMTSLSNYV